MCETFDERADFIYNELNYYRFVFQRNNMTNLLGIVEELLKELNLIKNIFTVYENKLRINFNNDESNHFDYTRLNIFYNYLELLWEGCKHIVHSIFDSSIKRRLDYVEITKNHEIFRMLCKHYLNHMKNMYEISVEASVGYDFGYYWKSLTNDKQGVIHIPKINSYYTRFYPLLCHETTHPVISLNTSSLLTENIYENAFVTINDFVLKHFEILQVNPVRNRSSETAAVLLSEILADIFSIFICNESYLWAFITSDLWPLPKQIISYWFTNNAWKKHPPNELRVKYCCEALNYLGFKKRAKELIDNWIFVNSIQDNFVDNKYTTNLKIFNEDFLNEFNFNEVFKHMTDKLSSIKLIPHKTHVRKDISKITIKDDPIIILNSIWNLRYKRFNSNIQDNNRDTTKILYTLYYSLKSRGL